MMTDSAIANGVLAVIADASLKATVVLAAAGLWTLLDRSASAAVRHLVWLVALGSALVLPAVVPFAPAWRVSLPLPDRPWLDAVALLESGEATAVVAEVAPVPVEWSAGADAAVAASTVAVQPADEAWPSSALVSAEPVERIAGDDVVAVFAADGGTVADDRHAADGPVAAAGLFLVWLVGVIAMATPRVRARLRLRRIAGVAQPVGLLRERVEARDVAAAMKLRRSVRLLEGPGGSMPMTWGIVRPVVLLPSDAWTWSAERLRTVLRHELAHVKRLDALSHAAADVACVLHWFNPLVWYAAKRLREESEHACDDRVLSQGGDPADYAAELVDLARSLRPARAAALAGLAMARGRSLRGRLIAVLDDERDRRPVSALDALRAAAIATFVILPLACLAPTGSPEPAARAVDAPDSVVAWEAADSPPSPAPALAREPEPSADVAVPLDVSEPAAVPAPIVYANPDAVPPSAMPDRPPRPDASPYVDVAPRLAESRGASPVAPPRPDGSPYVDIGPRPVPEPSYQSGPPDGASAPAPAARPDQRGRPDADLTERVLRQAAGGLGDREMADLLEVAAGSGGISNGATRSAYLDAARTIGSDRDLARALGALLATRPDEAGLVALVEATAGIGSDREAATVLETAAGAREMTAALRKAILRALDGIGSERERRRVLAALDGSPALR
jgi:beta-lactamase regulating signal transducer with metallopeptidase domain